MDILYAPDAGRRRPGRIEFRKSKALEWLTEDKNNVTFEDVVGVDEAKEEVGELVEFLQDPSRFQKLVDGLGGVLMMSSGTENARASDRGGSQGSVFHHLGFRFCRNVRGRRRLTSAGYV